MIRYQVVELKDFVAVRLVLILCQEPERGYDSLRQRRGDENGLEQDVHVEEVVVAHSHAIVDPRTMVVEALDTVATDRAVPAAACANCVTIGAELRALNPLEHVHEVDVVVAQVSGLRAGGAREEKETQYGEHDVQTDGPEREVYTKPMATKVKQGTHMDVRQVVHENQRTAAILADTEAARF